MTAGARGVSLFDPRGGSAMEAESGALYVPVNPVRFVTAASLFDGHDAAINIMRRILQAQGAEVIHLGHDRSVESIVVAALQEDAQGIAISSYQGGHVEYFSYLAQRLQQLGAGHVQIYGGGGGVIVAEEVELLASRGVKIFTPEDGARLGLPGMINDLIRSCDVDLSQDAPEVDAVAGGDPQALGRAITVLERGRSEALREAAREARARRRMPVLGITGTGGAGKSSLTDELLRRLRNDQEDKLRVAVLAVDPTRRRGGGALLGDRIRMNAIDGADPSRIFFRSLATRGATAELPGYLEDVINACALSGFDLVVVETPGIGQGDAAIAAFCDVALYVMTPEYGASSQLEKIQMLDVADVVAINKFERRGAEDARRDVARQLVRNRDQFGADWEDMPVFGTSAARFGDDGVDALYLYLRDLLKDKGLPVAEGMIPAATTRTSSGLTSIIPTNRVGYLAQVASAVREYHQHTDVLAAQGRILEHLRTAKEIVGEGAPGIAEALDQAHRTADPEVGQLLETWAGRAAAYRGDELSYDVRGREIRSTLRRKTLAGTAVPRVSLPALRDDASIVRFSRSENLPGYFPYTAGVFPLKREGESPTRMFAGEGDAFRTNRRFRLLARDGSATRLSTAFDSVTLYGRDPDVRPDIFGKVGTSGVSIATLDDIKVLYDGFDLCAPSTSVSMTINGPAPAILAMFLNAAIDQRIAAFVAEHSRIPNEDEEASIRAWVLANVRGTVQADILKEDQGQNTCIFSTEFSLRCMADVQEWFVQQRRAQLLLGLDLRLPHRGGWGQPDQPAGVHAREWIHLRRGLPRARDGHRRLRPESLVLLLQRDGRRVLGHRPGCSAHLGGCDARPLRR